MSDTSRFSLIPSGSLGLKMLLVCGLVMLMWVPLLFVEAIVRDRDRLATSVTAEISERAGGPQIVGGPMLLVPYETTETYSDAQNVVRQRTVQGNYVVFAETGEANATLTVSERRRGIYRASTYDADTTMRATFKPRDALKGVNSTYRFDWANARVAMFVRDARAVRSAAAITFADGTSTALEPLNDFAITRPESYGADGAYQPPANSQLFAAPVSFPAAPEELSVQTQLVLGGAQSFSVAAFAQDTTVSIKGDRRDASAQGFFQSAEPLRFTDQGFEASWRVPFMARAIDRAANLAAFDLSTVASRDMGVSFVASDDVYQGVVRAVRYAIMFIGIVFLATLIFEALSGKRAHAAQYILVGLAQSVFYLLLLALTEIIGFSTAFVTAAGATVVLLAYYAGASSRSVGVGVGALVGLTALYGVMYVLMTLEDFAFFAGSVVAFLVIAAAMISTSRINWYGRPATPAAPATS